MREYTDRKRALLQYENLILIKENKLTSDAIKPADLRLCAPEFYSIGTEFLQELFRYQYCDECLGDWYDHTATSNPFGLPFALCKIANNPNYIVRSREEGVKVVICQRSDCEELTTNVKGFCSDLCEYVETQDVSE
jgi:hypothetical protein